MRSARTTTAHRRPTEPWRQAAQAFDDALARRAPLAELRERHNTLEQLIDAAFTAATGACCSRSGPWSREVRELMTVREHYRLAAMSTAGVVVPESVQVGALHASGPYIAGMYVGPADNSISAEQPPIGVPLRAIVDAAQPDVPVRPAVAPEPQPDVTPHAAPVQLPVQARPEREQVLAVA